MKKSLINFVAIQLSHYVRSVTQSQTTWQQVLLPSNENLWRTIPGDIYSWLDLKYALFEEDKIQYITVQGRTDNHKGSSITDDNIDRVGRGLFFQDASFGWDSLDGFVVFYVQETQKWYTKSIHLQKGFYNLDSTTEDLTHYPSSWKWNCQVQKEEVSELVTCTRKAPQVADSTSGEIKIIPQIVVNSIGYRWFGSVAKKGEYEFGEQITFNKSQQLIVWVAGMFSLIYLISI